MFDEIDDDLDILDQYGDGNINLTVGTD